MTRRCVMCKKTNHKNIYSFFSAPKDKETRKKWQTAIGIKNYTVSDDTFVCSKHFNKDDIITHWVSGVPPHVVTVKYKKCRLKPGAVPGRKYNFEENVQAGYTDFAPKYDTRKARESKTDFLIPRKEENLENDGPLFAHDSNVHSYQKKNSSNETKFENGRSLNNGSEESLKTIQLKQEDINFVKVEEQNETTNKNLYSGTVSECSSKDYSDNEDMVRDHASMKMESIPTKETSTECSFESTEITRTEDQIEDNYNRSNEEHDSTYNEDDANEMLFEDLLEVCTEISLPRGWSCLIASEGLSTTIVYLYMGLTTIGTPYMEKQVFIKGDMILHCTAVNREINPVIHNLIKQGKHLKVQSLVDIEELISEFDQRVICSGINNVEGSRDINRIKIAYKDGIKWRHVLCPLILNNDSTRCTKCISLSRKLIRSANSPTKQWHRKKRLRKQDQECDLIKVYKRNCKCK